MTDVVNMRRESIDLEALLLSRAYLYMLFHKAVRRYAGCGHGGMHCCRRPRVTWGRVEEYAGDDPSMKGLRALFGEPRRVRRWRGADRAGPRRVPRLFIGRVKCPASRWNRPYRTKDAAVFRRTLWPCVPSFASAGFNFTRLMRIPDDHIATMCGFMAHEAERSLAELRAGNVGDLAASLRDEELRARPYAHLEWTISPAARRSRRRCSIRR